LLPSALAGKVIGSVRPSVCFHSIYFERTDLWNWICMCVGHVHSCLFGIHGSVLSWFKSYLSCRSFRVKCENNLSSFHTFSCGVPQGSVLFSVPGISVAVNMNTAWACGENIVNQKMATLTRVQRPMAAMTLRLVTLTFDPKINGFPGLMVEHTNVKFGVSSYIGFWDTMRKIRQTNGVGKCTDLKWLSALFGWSKLNGIQKQSDSRIVEKSVLDPVFARAFFGWWCRKITN